MIFPEVIYGCESWTIKKVETVKVAQSCVTLCNPMDCSPLSSSVHRILQARILEWVAILFSRGSSQSRNQTQVFCIAGRFLTVWATREATISITFRSVRVALISFWWNTDFDLLSYLLWGRDGWRLFQKFLPVLPHFDSSDFTGQENIWKLCQLSRQSLIYNYTTILVVYWGTDWGNDSWGTGLSLDSTSYWAPWTFSF